jgi:trigger factor
LEILLEKKSGIESVAKVSLKEADYSSEFSKKIKEYGKKANIKGFRPGKAPLSLVEKLVGSQMKADTILQTAFSNLQNYLQENNVEILGRPVASDIMEEISAGKKDLEVQFELNIAPQFTLDLSAIEITKYVVDYTDADIDESIARFRDMLSALTDTESVGEKTFITGKMTCGNFDSEKASFKMAEVKEAARTLFMGKKIGETVEFNFEDVFESNNKRIFDTDENLSGKTVLTINTLQDITPAEMNQKFFDTLFGPDVVHNEEELRERIRQIHTKDFEIASNDRLTYDVQKALLNQINFELTDEDVRRIIFTNQPNNSKISGEEFQKNVESIKKTIRWEIISSRFAKEQELKLQDVNIIQQGADEVAALLQQSGMTFNDLPEEDREKVVKNYITRDKGKHYEAFANKAHNKMIFDKMVELVKKNEKVVSAKEFHELPE